MNELIDIKPVVNVLEEEYKRLLGYPPGYLMEGRARELVDWARQWYADNGKPWTYSLQTSQIDTDSDNLKVCNVDFSSKTLRNQLIEAQAHNAMLVIVSAGKECEEKARELWLDGKPDEYFFLEIFGSAVVENLITNTGAAFCALADERGEAVLPHYSPGYPGWDVEDQVKLLKIIKQNHITELPGEIEVFQTGMLKPKKSMLALFGITKYIDKVRRLSELIPCESCSMHSCRYRRVPYRHSRIQIEDVHQLQTNTNIDLDTDTGIKKRNGNGKFVLTRNAKYSISKKALEKWSHERLKFKILNDASLEAVFRYEGSTCSNMGRSLEFDHYIKLSSAKEGYIINELNCRPSEGNNGFIYMCKHITDSESLLDDIENEKPIIGKPLDEILNWQRQFSPEGCYCNHEGREHKWALALEVLHYALVRFEDQRKTAELYL